MVRGHSALVLEWQTVRGLSGAISEMAKNRRICDHITCTNHKSKGYKTSSVCIERWDHHNRLLVHHSQQKKHRQMTIKHAIIWLQGLLGSMNKWTAKAEPASLSNLDQLAVILLNVALAGKWRCREFIWHYNWFSCSFSFIDQSIAVDADIHWCRKHVTAHTRSNAKFPFVVLFQQRQPELLYWLHCRLRISLECAKTTTFWYCLGTVCWKNMEMVFSLDTLWKLRFLILSSGCRRCAYTTTVLPIMKISWNLLIDYHMGALCRMYWPSICFHPLPSFSVPSSHSATYTTGCYGHSWRVYDFSSAAT